MLGGSSPGSRLRTITLIVLAVLLLAVPSALGVTLLRKSTAVQTSQAEAVREDSSRSLDVSEEVYNSVLVRGSQEEADTDTSITQPTSRIKVLFEGSPMEVANGSAVPLSSESSIVAEIFVSPYPPTGFEADVDLYLTTADGEPITDAEITIDYDMMFMVHGPFFVSPKNMGNGHYLSSYDFFMYGPWTLETYIEAPDQEASIYVPIAIYVWPEG